MIINKEPFDKTDQHSFTNKIEHDNALQNLKHAKDKTAPIKEKKENNIKAVETIAYIN